MIITLTKDYSKTKEERMKKHISWRKKFNGRALFPSEYMNIFEKI